MEQKENIAINQIYVTQRPYINPDVDASIIGELLIQMSMDELVQYVINNQEELPEVTTKNIPQFSKIDDVVKVLWILADSGIEKLDYAQIGFYLCPDNSTEGACRKYGENHYKLASQLGFVTPDKPYEITDLGFYFYSLDDMNRKKLLKKLILRIPIIQRIIIEAQTKIVSIREELGKWLSPSTVIRRSSNVYSLINLLRDDASTRANQILTNIMR